MKLPLVHSGSSRRHRAEQPHSDRQAPPSECGWTASGALAVDDEVDSLSLLRAVLEGVGATVTTAASRSIWFDKRFPNVMVADIGMPGMDSLQLIRALPEDGGAGAQYAGRGPHRVRRRGSHHIARERIPDAPREADDPLELVVAVASLAPRRVRA